MFDPIALLTPLVCAAICVRLVAFRRGGARYRFGVSVMAYLLAAATGCQALSELLGVYRMESPFLLLILLVLCMLVYRARGNVANILRLEWEQVWDGKERREGMKKWRG